MLDSLGMVAETAPHPLAEYLVQHKTRLADFAPRVDLTSEGLRLILRGKRQPSLDTAKKIAKATNYAVKVRDLRPDWASAA